MVREAVYSPSLDDIRVKTLELAKLRRELSELLENIDNALEIIYVENPDMKEEIERVAYTVPFDNDGS